MEYSQLVSLLNMTYNLSIPQRQVLTPASN